MKISLLATLFCLIRLLPADMIIVSTLPDPGRPLDALFSSAGVPLPPGTEVRLGAFPGSSSTDLIDDAADGGLTEISNQFVQFGETFQVGDGTAAQPGTFEILFREPSGTSPSAWLGETVSIMLTSPDGSEFLVARFPGQVFGSDSPTGLENLTSLHLADAQVILGQNLGEFCYSTAPAPARPSFETWMAQFPAITNANDRTLSADPDLDGRTNFLEYLTGGNPNSPNDSISSQLKKDDTGQAWFRIAVLPGIGLHQFQVQSSPHAEGPWLSINKTFGIDPTPPTADSSVTWIRYPIEVDQPQSEFFRVKITPAPFTTEPSP